jgi:4-hydroxy-tetrahydrodipicolinate reductase
MTTRIGIAGITGRMGQLLAQEIPAAGATLSGGTSRANPDLAALAAASDVIIDFTNAATAQPNAAIMATAVEQAATRIPIVYAANFSTGVNLVLALAERMAAALPPETYDAEIVEMHHRQKVDAPSGTAIGIGRAVAKGRGVRLEDVTESGRAGHTGPRATGAIGFAALRGGQVVGEHTLIFAAGTEHIALTHRAFDRRTFATGAVRAALWAVNQPPRLYSMMDVLGMT